MKIIAWIVGILISLFVIMLIIGANVSPEKSKAYAARDNAEAMCDKMMSDAALGTERRMTRDICDKLKAEMDRRVREAGSTSYQVPTSSVAYFRLGVGTSFCKDLLDTIVAIIPQLARSPAAVRLTLG